MEAIKIARAFIAWPHILFLFLPLLHASPLQLNQTTSPLTLILPPPQGKLPNLTALNPIPTKSTWPPIPFTIQSPLKLQYLHVISAGTNFRRTSSTSIRWTIALLLLRLDDLRESSPCPAYTRLGQTTYLQLEVMQPPPTVALCKWAISTFDGLLEEYGVREVTFTFGVGVDWGRYQGVFGIGLGPPMGGESASA